MEEKMSIQNILITGGAGFVGSNLCIYLKTKYPAYQIFALDNLKRRGSELNITRLQDHQIEFVHGDIRNAEDLSGFENIHVIIDASADPSVLSGITSPVLPLVNNNLIGTINCLELASKHDALFIFLSTSRVYPIKQLEACNFEELPTRFQWTNYQTIQGVSSKGITEDFPMSGGRSFYGTSKLCCEMLIAEYHEIKNLQTIINRCGVIGGPWQMGKVDQGVFVLWLAQHYFKKELRYIGYGGTGKQMRDILHIDELCLLIDEQIQKSSLYTGQTLNIGGGTEVSFSLQELTFLCQEITGNKITIKQVKENRPADIRIYVSDCSRLKTLSGWEPQKKIDTLVADTFLWINKNESQLKRILS